MENKKLYIGLGVLAFAGIGYYMWKKKQSIEEQKSNITACRAGTCPYKRTDGSIFCTSAACAKNDRNTTSI